MALIRKAIRRVFYPHPDTLAYTIELLNRTERARAVLGPGYGKPLDDSFRRDVKKSDTLAILGSGPSINDLDERTFDWIRAHDSVGFNWWLAHSFAPDFYLVQLPGTEASIAGMRRMFEHSKPRWQGHTRFLLRGDVLAVNPEIMRSFVDGLFDAEYCQVLTEFQLHSRLQASTAECVEFLEHLGLMPYGKIPRFIVKWQATLKLILSFAYNMGYSRVILFGIDMTSDEHFFDAPAYADLHRELGLPTPSPGAITNMTKGKYQTHSGSDVIVELANLLEDRGGMRTYLASPRSALAGRLRPWGGPHDPKG